MGGTLEGRKRVSDILRQLYRARSGVAHTGRLPGKKFGPREAQSALEASSALVARAVRLILELGDFPNWDDLVLEP